MKTHKISYTASNGKLFTIKPVGRAYYSVFVGKGTGSQKASFPSLDLAKDFCDMWPMLVWKPIKAADGRIGGAYFLADNTMFAAMLHPFTKIGYSFC